MLQDRAKNPVPCNIEAERAVLGALLFDQYALDEVGDIVTAQDFYRDDHRTLFSEIQRMYTQHEMPTAASLYKCIGGTDEAFNYLLGLQNEIIISSFVEQYARDVFKAAQQRRLAEASIKIAGLAYDNAVTDAISQAEALLFDIGKHHASSEFSTLGDIATEYLSELSAMENKPQLSGISTGFKTLDFCLGGLQDTDLLIAAGRPGMGKSAFALSIAHHAAFECGKRVAVFTLEMSKKQLFQRLVSREARVDGQRLRINRLDVSERDRVYNAVSKLASESILIDDKQGLTTTELRSKARRLKAKDGLDLIIVDYLQLMEAHIDGKRIQEKRIEIGEISKALKSLAKELEVPVLALAQLSREVEKRSVKIPQLSDLAESGNLEMDADVVLFLYRDDYYNPQSDRPGTADIIIAKHRSGPVGETTVAFDPQFTQFRDIEVRV